MDFVVGGWWSELKGLKLMQLHSRALDMGVEPEVVEEVSDSLKDILSGVLTLHFVALESGSGRGQSER